MKTAPEEDLVVGMWKDNSEKLLSVLQKARKTVQKIHWTVGDL